ncbi:MAG: hypothetical protein CME63_17865 [Halobacteriovoraceae bacterium]|nr:hypothetical protein [Halobacteriovoraceae bacterium]|tara:strand:- start:7270 stop:8142 length:873 start_codon:yes stop_codon:yes gene_type:complete
MAIYLRITEENKNQHIRIGARPIFIGRSSKCHITLKDNMVSGKHLAIKINGDGHVVIKDLDTTNGTYLNGNKIDESLLYLDDFIQVGRIKMSLVPKEMTSQELKIHQRDFERTNVTFVNLGNQVTSNDDFESDSGLNKQRTLLAKIREKNKQNKNNDAQSAQESPATQCTEKAASPSIVFDKDSPEGTPKPSKPQAKKKESQVKQPAVPPPSIETDEDLHEDLPAANLSDEPEVDAPDLSTLNDVVDDSEIESHDQDEEDEEEEYEYEYEYEDEDESPGLVSKLKGLFKR